MLKTCSICGQIHDINKSCPNCKQIRNSKADKFRNTSAWRKKREEIKRRDRYLCRYCFDIKHKVSISDLSVHHIEPLETAYHRRLDDDNLITLCNKCHKAAEIGGIGKSLLKSLTSYPPALNTPKIKEQPTSGGPSEHKQFPK